MKHPIRTPLAAIGVIAIFAALSWLGGFNFDKRNEAVAYVALWAVFMAGGAAMASEHF